jgi:hypothetical protein
MTITELTSIDFYGKDGWLYGWMVWKEPNNFYLQISKIHKGVISICDLGEIKGLNEITGVPSSGFVTPDSFSSSVECKPGHGYVIKMEINSLTAPVYSRLFVERPVGALPDTTKGPQVEYQCPFELSPNL